MRTAYAVAILTFDAGLKADVELFSTTTLPSIDSIRMPEYPGTDTSASAGNLVRIPPETGVELPVRWTNGVAVGTGTGSR